MDQFLLDLFNQTLASPWLDVTMPLISDYGLFALPLLGVCLFFNPFSTRTHRVGSTILIAQAAGFVLTFTFYYLAMRTRPDAVRLIVPQPNFPSFPSGHTVLAFATTMVLLLFGWYDGGGKSKEQGDGGHDDEDGRTLWKIVGCVVLLIAALIGVSRLYLGHHYPSDVVAGMVLGLATGASIFGLLLVDETGVQRFRWLLWLQVAVAILATMMAYLDLLSLQILSWPYADKVLHFLLFGAIAFWLYLWMPNVGIRIRGWLIPLAILMPITIALFEEILQGASSLRTASGVDLAADLAGMICFTLLAHWLIQRDQRQNILGGNTK